MGVAEDDDFALSALPLGKRSKGDDGDDASEGTPKNVDEVLCKHKDKATGGSSSSSVSRVVANPLVLTGALTAIIVAIGAFVLRPPILQAPPSGPGDRYVERPLSLKRVLAATVLAGGASVLLRGIIG